MTTQDRLDQLKHRIVDVERRISENELDRELKELLRAFDNREYQGKIESAIEQAKEYFQTTRVGRAKRSLLQDLTVASRIAGQLQRAAQ